MIYIFIQNVMALEEHLMRDLYTQSRNTTCSGAEHGFARTAQAALQMPAFLSLSNIV